VYLMNRDFEIARARMTDRLRRAEQARVAASVMEAATIGRAPVVTIALELACERRCEEPAAVREAA